MRCLPVLCSFLVLFAITACGDDDSASTPTDSPEQTTITTVTPSPEPQATPPADTDQRIRQCLDGTGATAQEALETLSNCRPFPGIATVEAFAGEGEIPVVLIDVTKQSCPRTASVVAWHENGSWSVQSLGDVLTTDNRLARPLRPPTEPGGPSARLVVTDQTRLGLILAENVCGSGAHEGYLLLELIDGQWVAAWDSNRTAIRELSHTKIEFEGSGVNTIYVRGASWYLEDAKSRTFDESNAGPHRWFEQVWVREGSEYRMHSGRVVPSPYNTLVEFIYALSSSDDQTATKLVTDTSLLDLV